jgi:copper chaperone CopZ
MDNIRFSIEGLQEVETQERVRNQLEGIVGIQNVFLSEGQNYVDINFDEQTSVAEINNHLQNNGYKII